MNIKEAKEQIQNAMTAYFTKDQFGNYVIPIEQQRPVFLMGPPGIGKTAIMEQIASELGVGLVSYSMTHHTRQSALGLPFIVEKKYGEATYSVSEYTMSEIIASVYDLMESTGKKEGILFLDEINCVSETLAPSMLQFLQYKVFGRHRVPKGWIVVTAGNPPEFNNSVRDFDIVTWDRLKRIDVEPDFDVWKEHAYQKNVHPAILTYLELKKSNFYQIATTVDGKSFVTARGWSDLSDMIKLYEQHGLKVDENLVRQYLQNRAIGKDFAIYYDLFNKYKTDYKIEKILDGLADDEVKSRAKNAKFDERLSLLGLIMSGITDCLKEVCEAEQVLEKLMPVVKELLQVFRNPAADVSYYLGNAISNQESILEKGQASSSLSREDQHLIENIIEILETLLIKLTVESSGDGNSPGLLIKESFEARVNQLKNEADGASKKLSNVFNFCKEVFDESQELLILVTELTINPYSARFISRYGCNEYYESNKELLFYERQLDIINQIESIDWDNLS